MHLDEQAVHRTLTIEQTDGQQSTYFSPFCELLDLFNSSNLAWMQSMLDRVFLG